MADENPMDGMKTSADALKASIAENMKMSERFYAASRKASGGMQEALDGVSAIYDKIAKQNQELLDTMELQQKYQEEYGELLNKQKDLEKELKTLKGDELKQAEKKLELNKKQLDVAKENHLNANRQFRTMERELTATKKQLDSMEKTGGLMGQVWSKVKGNLVAAVVSAEALRRALFSVLNVSRDMADISIMSGTYAGMGDDASIVGNAGMIAQYTKEVSKAQWQLSKFGYSAQEAKAAFKDFAQVSTDVESMNAMTQAAGGLSRMLGMDLSETTQFMIDQNLKFNRTALQTAEMLQKIQEQSKKLNEGFDRSVIKGRDVTKVLFDISRESRALAQDQDAISEILTRNVVKLQGTGATYQEAFESARSFTEMLTTKAPVFLQHFSGREVVKQLTQNRDQTLEMLKKTSPEIARRVQEIMDDKDLTEVSREKALNRLTQQTKLGLDASQKAMAETMRIFEKGAVDRITAVMGVDEVVAIQLRDQLKEAEGIRQIPEMIRDGMAIDDILAFSKKAFGEALPLADLEKLQKLNAEDREEELKAILLEKHLLEAKQAETDRIAAQHREVAELEEKRQQLLKEGRTLSAEQVQEEIDAKRKIIKAEEDQKLKGISDDMEDKLTDLDLKSYWDRLLGLLENPLAQMAVGVAGLAGMAKKGMEIYYLHQIARNTGMGSVVKTLGKGLGRGATVGKAALAVAGKAGLVGLAGAGGYLIGTGIDKGADKLTSSENAYGQKSNIFERGIGKLMMSREEYQDAYGTPAEVPVDVQQITTPPDTAGLAPGRVQPAGISTPGQNITQQASLVQGAQGANIQLITTLPIADAMAYNMKIMGGAARSPVG